MRHTDIATNIYIFLLVFTDFVNIQNSLSHYVDIFYFYIHSIENIRLGQQSPIVFMQIFMENIEIMITTEIVSLHLKTHFLNKNRNFVRTENSYHNI